MNPRESLGDGVQLTKGGVQRRLLVRRTEPSPIVPSIRTRPETGPAERWSAWMAAAQRGDRLAYETLLRELLPPLRGFVRRHLENDASSEDVVQTVLLSLHRARHSYLAERPFEPWLWAIARNAIRDFHRQRGRRTGREVPFPEDDVLPASLHATADAVEALDGGEAAISPELADALAKLPDNQREAVVLLHLEGLSLLEAALRVRVSPSALKVRVHRARRALRRLLDGVSR